MAFTEWISSTEHDKRARRVGGSPGEVLGPISMEFVFIKPAKQAWYYRGHSVGNPVFAPLWIPTWLG